MLSVVAPGPEYALSIWKQKTVCSENGAREQKFLNIFAIGSDISIKSLKRKTQHQRRLQFNQRVKRAF